MLTTGNGARAITSDLPGRQGAAHALDVTEELDVERLPAELEIPAQGALEVEGAAPRARPLDRDHVLQAVRKPRASAIQGTSRENTWMRQATDPMWVYGHDVWQEPLPQ